MSNTAFARTIPAHKRAKSWGNVVRLPAPIFERDPVDPLALPVPPQMGARSFDGIWHRSARLAMEWNELQAVLTARKVG